MRKQDHNRRHRPGRLSAAVRLLFCGLLPLAALPCAAGSEAGAIPDRVEHEGQCRRDGELTAETMAETLPLYEASYEARSHGLSTTAHRQLQHDEDGGYRVSHGLSVSVLGATVISVEESSRFRWQSPYIVPQYYDYQQEGVSRRWETMEFDWQKGQALVRARDADDVETALLDGVLDQLSFQVQLRMDVRSAARNAGEVRDFRYRIMDGGTIECHLYRLTGEETLETPAGEFDTVRLERIREEDNPRSTVLWLAPELDFQLARLEQTNGSGRRTELVLESLEPTPESENDDAS